MFLVFNELKESVLERGIVMAVNEKLRDHLHDQLFRAILELKSVEECYEFFEDLCTIQEMKAISARLEVARMLKVYGSGGYEKILSRMAEKDPDFLKLSK
jgi:TrpR-related protein YerC/YecD